MIKHVHPKISDMICGQSPNSQPLENAARYQCKSTWTPGWLDSGRGNVLANTGPTRERSCVKSQEAQTSERSRLGQPNIWNISPLLLGHQATVCWHIENKMQDEWRWAPWLLAKNDLIYAYFEYLIATQPIDPHFSSWSQQPNIPSHLFSLCKQHLDTFSASFRILWLSYLLT